MMLLLLLYAIRAALSAIAQVATLIPESSDDPRYVAAGVIGYLSEAAGVIELEIDFIKRKRASLKALNSIHQKGSCYDQYYIK